jgi:hypothetical protein
MIRKTNDDEFVPSSQQRPPLEVHKFHLDLEVYTSL